MTIVIRVPGRVRVLGFSDVRKSCGAAWVAAQLAINLKSSGRSFR